MQVLKAAELFNDLKCIDDKEFEGSGNISIDFTEVCSIDLKAINTLLKMQKVAVLNGKTLSVSNVSPNVRQILEVTGLNKTFSQNATCPISRN